MTLDQLIRQLQDARTQYGGDTPVHVCAPGSGSVKADAVQFFPKQTRKIGITTIQSPDRIVVFGKSYE